MFLYANNRHRWLQRNLTKYYVLVLGYTPGRVRVRRSRNQILRDPIEIPGSSFATVQMLYTAGVRWPRDAVYCGSDAALGGVSVSERTARSIIPNFVGAILAVS